MKIEENVTNAIQVYVEVALHVYGTAYRSALKGGFSEEQRADFAREILRSFLQPKQERTDPALAQKMAWLTSGGVTQ